MFAAAKLLPDHNADPNVWGSDGCNALLQAAADGQTALVELLIQSGADINAVHRENGATALHTACWSNHTGCVAVLVANGCDVAAKADDGRTCVQWAEYQGNTSVLEIMRSSS